MSFQKCPKCEATGKQLNDLPMTGIGMIDFGNVTFNGLIKINEARGMKNVCVVCKGKMIISTKTGLPPTT